MDNAWCWCQNLSSTRERAEADKSARVGSVGQSLRDDTYKKAQSGVALEMALWCSS